MKKIGFCLIISCFAIHCKPPPKRPEKDHHLHLENLIYEVALSSLKISYRMDIKRKGAILKRVNRLMKKDRESFFVAVKALEDRIEVLEGKGTSEDMPQVKVQQSEGFESETDEKARDRSLEEKLTQLEALILGGEDLKGILFRVKFLKGHLPVSSDVSATEEGAEEEEAVTPAAESADAETRLENLTHLIQGILSQVVELENAVTSVSLTEDQVETLSENTADFVEEWKSQIPEGAFVEDRLLYLENLIYGTEDWEGIVSEVTYLQSQLSPVPPEEIEASDE